MRSLPFSLTALAATAALAAGLPSTAAAYDPTGAECTLSVTPELLTGPVLSDPLGYYFDVTTNITPLGLTAPSQYATIANGGLHGGTPGTGTEDAFDNWGDLYVGDGERPATQYLDDDRLGCHRELNGRQIAFKPRVIGDLSVQRMMLVSSAASGGGARLTQTVTNPTGAAITTSVYVGDLTASLGKGSLGSDSDTRVGPTSSGDTQIDASDDQWAVTSDGGRGGDPAIAHVWGGVGAPTPATIARSGAQNADPVTGTGVLRADKFGYGWERVTIPAGGTATFLSWEIIRAAETNAQRVTQAEQAAAALTGAPATTIFEGMTAREIKSVRNWPVPAPAVGIVPVAGATIEAPVSLRTEDLDLSGGLPECAGGQIDWNFGDGATATGTGAEHRFAAGPATVSLVATNRCGGRTVRRLTFDVAAPAVATPAVTPLPTAVPTPAVETPVTAAPTPAPPASAVEQSPSGSASRSAAEPKPAPAAPTAPAAVGPRWSFSAPARIRMSELTDGGLMAAVVSPAPGAFRVALTGGSLKLTKSMTLAAGDPRTPTFKLGKRDARKLKKVTALQLEASFTPVGGAEQVQTRTVALRR